MKKIYFCILLSISFLNQSIAGESKMTCSLLLASGSDALKTGNIAQFERIIEIIFYKSGQEFAQTLKENEIFDIYLDRVFDGDKGKTDLASATLARELPKKCAALLINGIDGDAQTILTSMMVAYRLDFETKK
jgi:hypothetical protein